MSTSLLYHGFGLREVEYQKTVYEQGRVVFYIQPQALAVRCPTCHSQEIRRRGQKERTFRHLPIGRKPVEVVCSLPRVECHNCGELRPIRIPFADPHKRYTRALERYALELCRVMTLQDVAAHLEMSWDTVKDMEKGRLQRRYGRPKLKRVRRLAIDEIAVRKGHVYLTVVLDLESGAVLFVGHGKEKKALQPFWKRLRGSGAKIQAVAIDMSPAYEAAVREDKDEKKRLEEALKINQTLATAYYLKESLREQFWLYINVSIHLPDEPWKTFCRWGSA